MAAVGTHTQVAWTFVQGSVPKAKKTGPISQSLNLTLRLYPRIREDIEEEEEEEEENKLANHGMDLLAEQLLQLE